VTTTLDGKPGEMTASDRLPEAIDSTAETTAQKQRVGRPFEPGQSGNPSGRPKGARNKTTLAVESLLDGEAETITRKAIELAKSGNLAAIRLCLDRIAPPRKDRPIPFSLPTMDRPGDVCAGLSEIIAGIASGELTPGEASELSKVVDSYARALLATELEARVKALEVERK
jgi:hypothetical protein